MTSTSATEILNSEHSAQLQIPYEESRAPDSVAVNVAVAVVYKVGQASHAIGQFIDSIPSQKSGQTKDEKTSLFIRDIVSTNCASLGHVTYKGSLTTPPYTEAVRRFVKRSAGKISPPQTQRTNQMREITNVKSKRSLGEL